MNILTIDVGTSSMRGILYNKEGQILLIESVKYAPVSVKPGYMEQEPSSFRSALTTICQQITVRAKEADLTVDAMSLTSQRSSIIPMGEDDKPLRSAIMWQDTRNAEIVAEMKAHETRITELTGARVNTVFSGTKMTWFRRNQPELYKKTRKICTIADYLVHEMTGNYVSDQTYGARSLLMNLKKRDWDPELLDLFSVERDKLCTLIAPGSIAGQITADFSAETGIPAGIPLISAGGDQQTSALGQGICKDGSLEITVGTGAFLLKYSDQPYPVGKTGFICGCHCIPEKYVLEGSLLGCAALYNWANQLFYRTTTEFAEINQAVCDTPAGSNGVIALPFFQGRGTPDWNAGAKGAYLNLNLGSGRGEMTRSILESLAYEIRNNIEALNSMNAPAEYIRVGGGMTKFSEFAQILADVLETPIHINEKSVDDTAMGAWIISAVTLGLYANVETAYAASQKDSQMKIYTPNPANYTVYRKAREEMNRAYAALN